MAPSIGAISRLRVRGRCPVHNFWMSHVTLASSDNRSQVPWSNKYLRLGHADRTEGESSSGQHQHSLSQPKPTVSSRHFLVAGPVL